MSTTELSVQPSSTSRHEQRARPAVDLNRRVSFLQRARIGAALYCCVGSDNTHLFVLCTLDGFQDTGLNDSNDRDRKPVS